MQEVFAACKSEAPFEFWICYFMLRLTSDSLSWVIH